MIYEPNKWPGSAPWVSVTQGLLSSIGMWEWSQYMAWLCTTSLCISVVTALSRYVGVISVNGLALYHESLYLSGYCAQSVSGSDLSKWPGPAPRVSVSPWLLQTIGMWSDLSKRPGSAPESLYLSNWHLNWVFSYKLLNLTGKSRKLTCCQYANTEILVLVYTKIMYRWGLNSRCSISCSNSPVSNPFRVLNSFISY